MELKRLQVEAEDLSGTTDEYAAAVVTEHGFFIEGFFADTVGLSWIELSRLLEDPVVQSKLEEAELIRKS